MTKAEAVFRFANGESLTKLHAERPDFSVITAVREYVQGAMMLFNKMTQEGILHMPPPVPGAELQEKA